MDIQLNYVEQGEGTPLVLLHGNGEDCTYFVNQIEYFNDKYRVIAIDTRGHGESPLGSAPFSLYQFALDLNAFLDEHDIESAHILGFSDGANIAMLFALKHPERAKSLVLNGGNLNFEGLTREVQLEIERELVEATRTGDERALSLLRIMRDEPTIEPAELAKLTMPVLVIVGDDDMIAEEHTRLIADSIPGSQLEIIEGTHFIAAENSSEFNRVVDRFLQRVC